MKKQSLLVIDTPNSCAECVLAYDKYEGKFGGNFWNCPAFKYSIHSSELFNLKIHPQCSLIAFDTAKLSERKERLEQFNGTDLFTFFYMITENEWYNTDNCEFNITVDGDKEQVLTVKQIKEKYKNYYVGDYDLTHEIKNDQYEITGWLDLYKDTAQEIIQQQFEEKEIYKSKLNTIKEIAKSGIWNTKLKYMVGNLNEILEIVGVESK